ncbi:MAG: acetoin utilization protein AcuC [Chloroflexi bacterium]|nr:acetoin utilization protein AcuC [Chloroflexota bacterium]
MSSSGQQSPESPQVLKPKVAFVYADELSQYRLSPEHPLRPVRLHHMQELMLASGLLDLPNVSRPAPRPATRAEIESAHDPDYVSIVEAISSGAIAPGKGEFGLGTPDNPTRSGMYDTTALCVGTALVASELVMSGEADIGFAPAGGVHHHAMRRHASGFGVFNDAVIAMNAMVDAGLRVAYIDIDCHHGDGVQAGHYDSDRVLTISIHESGQWLFPGTGYVQETGSGDGAGYSVNIPLAPYTQDDDWHMAFDAVIPDLVRAFEPDVLFTQLGIDTHFQDPLTHLSLTTQGFNLAVRKLGRLGAEIGKWVAVGGGGYDLSAVARAWTMALATMADFSLPDDVPESFTSLADTSLEGASPGTPEKFADVPPPPNEHRHLSDIQQHNSQTLDEVRSLIFPKFGL